MKKFYKYFALILFCYFIDKTSPKSSPRGGKVHQSPKSLKQHQSPTQRKSKKAGRDD